MTDILITALATYGISSIVAHYDGLGQVFMKLRQKYPTSAFTCTICLATWVAIPIATHLSIGVVGYLAALGLILIVERNK